MTGRTSRWTWPPPPPGSAHHHKPVMRWACGRPRTWNPLTSPPPAPDDASAVPEPASWPDAVEVDRVVPPSGNMTVGPQQFWLGTARAGQKVTLWIDTTTVHLSIGGWRIKTVPSRLTEVDLARLRRADARPAGPPPAGPSPGALAASRCVEVDRLVNAHRRYHPGQPADPGRLPAGRAAGPPPPRWPADARPHPGRRAVAHPALPHPARPAAPAARRPPRRARTAARSRRHGAAAGVLPRRHPGRPPAHPGWA